MRKLLTAKTRITFGMVCLLVSILCTAIMIGMVPDRRGAILLGRRNLCEAIAISSSDYLGQGELRRLEFVLQGIVERNDEVLSAGIRRDSGELVAEVENHVQLWQSQESERSTDTQVLVPIRSGQGKWGTVEIRFRPINEPGLMGWLQVPWLRLTLFVTAASFLVFFVYLGKMLQHLDPSRSVPQRVRAALDSLAEGLLVIDTNDRIVLANQSFANWVRRSPEKLLGVPASKLDWVLDEPSESAALYPWVTALREQKPQAGAMLGLKQKNKPPRVLMANASPVLGHDGKYRGVLVSFDDVTQLEETKKNLNVAKKAAEDANQAKSEFLARMSHEIRTPMNAILGYTDVLRRGFDENIDDRQEYLDTIHASGEHLLSLINDILDLSKIESGRMDLELARHSPFELISHVVSVMRVKAEQKGITLEFDGDGPLPETIRTDSVRLRQAIMNLVGNAIKFTEQGGVRIVTRLLPGKRAAERLLAIDVIDTGIGISPQAQESIFDPFSQADTTITRRFGGTGLGLAISRQLAEAMGGGIGLRSELGLGSVFTLTVATGPLENVRMLDAGSATLLVEQTETKKKRETPQLPPARILVADDGAANRKLIQLVLSRAGLEVFAVENGKQALEKAMSGSFDVVLMDMQMPVMDGYMATREMRNKGYQRPIIALTAHAMQGAEEKCRAAGCSDFLTKPISIDELLARLKRVLTETRGSDLPRSPTIQETPRQVAPRSDAESRQVDQIEQEIHELLVVAPHVSPAFNDTSSPSGKLAKEAELEPLISSLPMDDQEFREIVADFVETLKNKLDKMRQAFESRDFAELAAYAHWLKGSGETVGFAAFTAPAKVLESLAKQQDAGPIPIVLDELDRLASRIVVPCFTD